MENSPISRWRAHFFAGLVIILPAVVSLAFVFWCVSHLASVTSLFLYFVPDKWTHPKKPNGELEQFIAWYWSYITLALTVFGICLVGRYGRNYFAQKAIDWTDQMLMQIPLLNKIYSTVKQVNESFSSNKSSFKQVALVAFPHANSRSVGFVTGEQTGLGGEKLISIFIPTTPNPTSGFLILVPESEVVKLDISVADGIKFIISLGALAPESGGHIGGLKPEQPRGQDNPFKKSQ